MFGERTHERGFAGSAVDHEHAGIRAWWFGVEHVSLEVAYVCSNTLQPGVPQMEPHAFDKQIMVGTAMPRKMRRAEPTVGAAPPQGRGQRRLSRKASSLRSGSDDGTP
jgi:hypothetical protein